MLVWVQGLPEPTVCIPSGGCRGTLSHVDMQYLIAPLAHLGHLYLMKRDAMNRIENGLAEATVLSLSGESTLFRTLYGDKTTVIAFVRHFGCIFCRERFSDLAQCLPRLEAAGMAAAVIGNGTPLMAKDFSKTVEVDLPLYTDPSRTVFEMARMQRNFGLGLATIRRGIRSWRAGHRQGAVAGDPWQQGGCLVVEPGGRVLASEYDRDAGQLIDFDAVIGRAIRAA